MKISTKGRYGIKALIDLVMNSENESVTLKTISKRQNISENLWKRINDKINEYFKSITLQDLVDKYKLSKEGIIYYI